MNQSNLFLTPSEVKALKKISSDKTVKGDVVSQLSSLNLIYARYDEKLDCLVSEEITPAGERYLAEHKARKSESRWTRGLAIIALLISIASLAVATASLYLQYLSRLQ